MGALVRIKKTSKQFMGRPPRVAYLFTEGPSVDPKVLKRRENWRRWASKNKPYLAKAFKDWMGKQKPHRNGYSKAYYQKHRTKILANNRKWCLKNRSGMAVEQYDSLMIEQNGACAICKRLPYGKGRASRLVADHNHTTGKGRALLCTNCNSALGLFGESLETLDRARAYLRLHNRIPFVPGDPIEVKAIDHTTEDVDGWQNNGKCMESTPSVLNARGYYIGADEKTIKIAMIKCDEDYGTVFNVIKAAIIEAV